MNKALIFILVHSIHLIMLNELLPVIGMCTIFKKGNRWRQGGGLQSNSGFVGEQSSYPSIMGWAIFLHSLRAGIWVHNGQKLARRFIPREAALIFNGSIAAVLLLA